MNAAEALAVLAADWAGAVVVAIGGGPSLTQEQVDYCRGKANVIAVNNAIERAPWADLLYFCDERWYRWHEARVRAFNGARVTLENRGLAAELPGLICMRDDTRTSKEVTGLCEDPDGLRTGNNGGYQVLNLAAHLGARRVVLLGYDMRAAGGKVHWHEEHAIPTPPECLSGYADAFHSLVAPLAARGLEVLNATPGSALDAFPRVPLAEALS